MDLVNNYIYILEIPINIISKLRSLLRQNLIVLLHKKRVRIRTLFLCSSTIKFCLNNERNLEIIFIGISRIYI